MPPAARVAPPTAGITTEIDDGRRTASRERVAERELPATADPDAAARAAEPDQPAHGGSGLEVIRACAPDRGRASARRSDTCDRDAAVYWLAGLTT
jgi:hypothetical protein